jgi:ribulose-phosphate 3-epimerase
MSTRHDLIVAPSLLAADFGNMKAQIAAAEAGGADWLHCDVMDGMFVPNITFGPPVISAWRKLTSLPFDVHLMIERPERYIEDYRRAGADMITVHQETCPHLHRTIEQIRMLGARAGVCLNPSTPVETLGEILAMVDLVLIMTVNPGFGGQKFISASPAKIARMAAMIRAVKPSIRLEVDGGIDVHTTPLVTAAGADTLVAGTAVFGSSDIAAAIHGLRAAAVLPG